MSCKLRHGTELRLTQIKSDVHAPSHRMRRSVRSKPTRLIARAACSRSLPSARRCSRWPNSEFDRRRFLNCRRVTGFDCRCLIGRCPRRAGRGHPPRVEIGGMLQDLLHSFSSSGNSVTTCSATCRISFSVRISSPPTRRNQGSSIGGAVFTPWQRGLGSAPQRAEAPVTGTARRAGRLAVGARIHRSTPFPALSFLSGNWRPPPLIGRPRSRAGHRGLR